MLETYNGSKDDAEKIDPDTVQHSSDLPKNLKNTLRLITFLMIAMQDEEKGGDEATIEKIKAIMDEKNERDSAAASFREIFNRVSGSSSASLFAWAHPSFREKSPRGKDQTRWEILLGEIDEMKMPAATAEKLGAIL